MHARVCVCAPLILSSTNIPSSIPQSLSFVCSLVLSFLLSTIPLSIWLLHFLLPVYFIIIFLFSPCTRSMGTQIGNRWRGRPSEPSTWRPRTSPAAPPGPLDTRPHPRPHRAAPPHASAPLHPACNLLKPKRRAGSLTHLLLELIVAHSLADCTLTRCTPISCTLISSTLTTCTLFSCTLTTCTPITFSLTVILAYSLEYSIALQTKVAR